MKLRTCLTFVLIVLVANLALAQQTSIKEEKKKNDKPILAEEKFVATQHSVRIGGQEVRYTATPGQLVLRRPNGEPRGNMFFVAYTRNGVTDMATPYAATEWTFDHLGFEPTYRERVRMTYYEAGHMMYIRPSMLQKFKQDVAQFIRDSKDAALKTME